RFCDLLRGFEIREAEIFVGVLARTPPLALGDPAPWRSEVRGADVDATTAGLDRRARAHVPLFRRAEAAGSRQSEERGQQGLLLRSRDQPDLWGHGGALLGRRPA